MRVDMNAAAEMLKQSLGFGAADDSLVGSQLCRAVAEHGQGVLLKADALRSALEREGAFERDIQVLCLMAGAPGLKELLEKHSASTQADLDHFVRNAMVYTGLSRETVLLKTYQICRAAGLPISYIPDKSQPFTTNGTPIAYAFPPEMYEPTLRPFRAAFDREQFKFVSKTNLNFRTLGPLVQAGIPEAQFYLGIWGLESAESSATALGLLEEAANNGNELAAAALGDYYFDKGFGKNADTSPETIVELHLNSPWDRALQYYTGYGAIELNSRRKAAVTSIINHGIYNKKLKILCGALFAVMVLALFAIPGLMIDAPHPIWGIICLLLEAVVYALMLRALKIHPHMHAENYPLVMSSVWIIFLILRVLF